MEPTRRIIVVGVAALTLLGLPVTVSASVPPAPQDLPAAAVCDGDGVSGKRVQVLYVRELSMPDQLGAKLAEFQQIANDASDLVDVAAQQTGGTRHIRYVHDTACQPTVERVVIPDGRGASPWAVQEELRAQGHNRADRKYVGFVDSAEHPECGVTDGPRVDDQPGPGNLNNDGDVIASVWPQCWQTSVFLHETLHALGAVVDSAPNGTGGHCFDSYDVMCYSSSGQFNACPPQPGVQTLDCLKDDYFNTNPRPGSYLASHWNVATSQFLVGATDNTVPPPVFPRLAPATLATSGTGSLTTRWTNDSDYSFVAGPTRTDTGISTARIGNRYAAGDVNGDGHDDAIAAYQQTNGTLRLYVWPGGTGAPVAWYTGATTFSLTGVTKLVSGDFNGDGRDDVAFLRPGSTGPAQLYRALSTGTAFGAPVMTWSGTYDLAKLGARLAVGDVDADGRADLVGMYAAAPRPFPTTYLHVWLQAAAFQGDATWGTDSVLDVTQIGDRFTVGDFNADGLADAFAFVVSDTENQPYWWHSDGTRFTDVVTPATSSRDFVDTARAGTRVVGADVTGDGIDDVTMAMQEPDGTYEFHVFRGGWRWMGQQWYQSATYDLNANVGGRFVIGNW